MDVSDFRVLYEYNAWANRRMLDASSALTPEQFLRDMKSSFASVRDTVAHIYGAEFIWLERWNNRVPETLPKPSDFDDLESWRNRLTELDHALIAFVATLSAADLSRTIVYKQLNGTAHSGSLAPMLQHVVNHSTYHRGQVTTLLRQLGAKAVSTDLIAYHRELATSATA